MRILLTADPGIPVPPVGYGGVERIVDALARHYRGNGHIVGLVAQQGSRCEVDERFEWPHAAGGSGLDMARGSMALLRAVRQFRPDILHSYSRLAYMAPQLLTSLPKVMSYQRHTGGGQIRWASRLARRTLRFTGCSEFICSMGRPSGGDWSVIHNFVDTERYTFAPTVPDNAPLVFLGRVESIKGPHIAIQIARASGRRLILAGNRAEIGSERGYWEQKIEGNIGRDGIEWIGEVNDGQKDDLLGRAAALVVPIQWDEPFGIVFAEALACGTPIITCARGALPEIVEPGLTGFFVKDVPEGVAAVGRLHELDRSACRKAAEEQFSLRVCANEYLGLYEDMRS
jgi:glycosyltransferase involved in cell wall biosynthesis